MTIRSQILINLTQPGVVGTVHSLASMAAARNLKHSQCDWLELRIDNFFPETADLLRLAPRLPCPRIVTIRHPSEGGASPRITTRQRKALYGDFMGVAGLVDIELSRAKEMKDVIRQARDTGVGVILSHHNFRLTPQARKLGDLACRALESGADVFKVATMANGVRDLASLIEFLANEKSRLPLSVMGMGMFGKISRLVLARAGSCLNYGYLGAPNASGQWPVALLKARIAELSQQS